MALELLEKARQAKYPVTQAAVMSFGRSATKTLLAGTTVSEAERKKLEGFKAGEKWAKNFVRRNGLESKNLFGEAGSVDHEKVKEGLEAIRQKCEKYDTENIYNVDETGLQYKLMPKRTYLSMKENRKTARGTKDMHFKDRISAFMCANASGTDKVEMVIIGKAKKPRCFEDNPCSLTYFQQANAWADTATFRKWWLQVFLPHIRRTTHRPVLLLMDGCSSHEDLQDDKAQVTVMVYPPNCTSVHQPMDQGIIAATKVLYRRELLDVKLSIMLVAAQLRAEAKERKMARGTQGLANGSHPHMSDAADLLKLSWSKVTTQTIARYGERTNCCVTLAGRTAYDKPYCLLLSFFAKPSRLSGAFPYEPSLRSWRNPMPQLYFQVSR